MLLCRAITICLTISLFLAATAEASSYSLRDCIEIAIKRNPKVLASAEQLRKSYLKVDEAKSDFYPSIDLNINYQRDFQEARAIREQLNFYSSTFNINQNILDFGRTLSRVKAQEELLKATEWQRLDTISEVVYNVKEAYFNLLKARKNRETALEVLKQAQKHFELAKGFFEVGLKPKIEVTKAEVELSNAKLSLISAERAVSEALENLKVAIGLSDSEEFDIVEETASESTISEEEALKIALDRNPQLQYLRKNIQSAQFLEDSVRSEFLPKVSGSLRAGLRGEDFPLRKNWSVLIQVNLPLFSGFATTQRLKQVMADRAYYIHTEEALRQQIVSQLRKLFIQLKETSQRIETLKVAQKQAKENLDLAIGRYEVGIGTSIEVVDAIVLFEQTNTKYWQAVYEREIVKASIERLLGAQK